jgi:hypothetical protein
MRSFNILKFIISKPRIPSITYNHKARYTLEQRLIDSNHIYHKLQKIPLILEKDDLSELPEFEIKNFIVPEYIKICEFIVFLRKNYMHLSHNITLFLFVSKYNYVPDLNESIGNLYKKYKDNDNFLYCKYSSK